MGSIHKLPEDVINRIAAGEVVQRPSAALKELLENSIDAGCTRVQVLAAEGGLDVLQVSDDGSGIHKADLPLLCERYATSKLHSFEDLHRVTSFGFRGEALASVSYVARVTVTTRRRSQAELTGGAAGGTTTTATRTAGSAAPLSSSSDSVAWRAQYLNGALLGEPQPCAGNPGTTIRAEKLFYNALVRRHSLRASEEWSRIVDVVSRYALAFPAIGFACHRDRAGGAAAAAAPPLGASSSGSGSGAVSAGGGISFPPRSSTRHNIRLSHGSQLASHLRLVYAYNVETAVALPADAAATQAETEEVQVSTADAPPPSPAQSTPHSAAAQETHVFAQMRERARRVRATSGAAGEGLFTVVGYTSDPTLALRKPYLCLFVNDRLVESGAIRKAIDGVYSGVLTGGNRPFTVLLLSVPTDRVDVNVHPTKKEVCLLDEDLLVARVAAVCRGAVLEAAAARQMDMLKMRHTAALALKQLPIADGAGATAATDALSSTAAELAGCSSQHILEKLREQHQRGLPLASPLTSSAATGMASSGAGGLPAGAGGPAVVVAPCTMVRVEPQRGALDKYFAQRHAAVAAATTGAASPCPVADTTAPAQAPASVTGADRRPSAVKEDGAVAAYEAPSWEAVMASLHSQRPVAATEADARRGRSPTPPLSVSAEAAGGLGAAAEWPIVCVDRSDEATRGAVGGGDASMKETTHTQCEATMGDETACASSIACAAEPLGGVGSNALHRTRAIAFDAEEGDGDGDEDDEDDGMREFKRHRDEVHARAELLLKRKEGIDGGAVRLEPLTDAHVPPTASHAIGNAGDGARRLAAPSLSAESAALSHLGAVVRAADMLRGEAAAAEARSTHAPTVVLTSDDDGDEEGRTGLSPMAPAAAAALVDVAEVPAPALLSSVSIIVERLLADASPTADALVSQLAFVGVVDDHAFLAQAGTSLLWCDTMTLVRHAVFQRIFLRWGQPALPAPPVMAIDPPVRLADLLLFALAYDAPLLQPPTATLLALAEACGLQRARAPPGGAAHGDAARDQGRPAPPTAEAVQRMGGLTPRTWRRLLFEPSAQDGEAPDAERGAPNVVPAAALPAPRSPTLRYVRRLVRRLCRWRGLLKEYFFVDLSEDGLLVGLPYGLNGHWPPRLRAVPAMMWRLAEAVPYPSGAEAGGTGCAGADAAGAGSGTPTLKHLDGPLRGSPLESGNIAAEPCAAATSRSPAPTQTGAPTPSATSQPTAVEAEADGVAQEVACFTAIAGYLAETLFGAPPPLPPPDARGASLGTTSVEQWREALVQHGLFPCLKNAQLFRMPDRCVRDGTLHSMVSVESLYKVFERC